MASIIYHGYDVINLQTLALQDFQPFELQCLHNIAPDVEAFHKQYSLSHNILLERIHNWTVFHLT